MTDRRRDLAVLLTHTAEAVATLFAVDHAVGDPRRAFLAPLTSSLSTATTVLSKLSDELEEVVAKPLPQTTAGLFVLTSFATAIGRLADATGDLMQAVEMVCRRAGVGLAEPYPIGNGGRPEPKEFATVSSIAEAAHESFNGTCQEIHDGLISDAACVRSHAGTLPLHDGPGTLPTLIRSPRPVPGS